VGANPTELMHQCESPQDGMIIDDHVTRKRRPIREYGVISDNAIMGYVNISHDPIVIAETGGTTALNGTPVYGAVFAYGVAVTYFQPRLLTRIFHVLGFVTNRGKLKDSIAGADTRWALNDDMRDDRGVPVNLDACTNH
jgi:hypothetical protein